MDSKVDNIQHRHFVIHKPLGFLSQFINNEKKRKNRPLLGELHDFPDGTMSIGRLDKDSEGLLFLTTDGLVSEQVRSKSIEKEYYAQVDGLITDEAVLHLQTGVDIRIKGEEYTTRPCKANPIKPDPIFPERTRKIRDERHGPTSWVSITLTEGKYRQVRKMTAAVGFATLRLIRVRIGTYTLDDLAPGGVVEVERFDPYLL